MDKHEIYANRIAAVRKYMADHALNGALFTSYENRRYFSGFTGSHGYLIISFDRAVLITDKRYTTQAQQQTVGVEVVEYLSARLQMVSDYVKAMGIDRIVMEACMTMEDYLPLKDKLGDIYVTFEQEYFLEQRMVKTPDEIVMLKEAIAIAEAGFDRLLPQLKAGMTEKDVADELHYFCAKAGAESIGFGTIVGSGPRGALAHAFPTSKKIENGEMVVIDFGVTKNGYFSDMTRTLLFGDVSPEHMRIFNLVQESQDKAIAAIRPGVLAKDVEDAHRSVFLRENLDSYALRGLGHGIGLQIHECPRIVIGNETVLKPGMVFTVEPGLYFPGDCGVRTEDDVLVTEDGVKNLSHTPHEIHIG